MSPPTTDSPRDFLALARDMKMLTAEQCADLEHAAAAAETSLVEAAIQKGILDPIQVDILETLTHPAAVIPGYEVQSLVGQGGMGVVYRARQVNLDRTVALKTILVNQMSDPTNAARFEQEALAVGKLRHHNIVGAYDFGKSSGRLFLAMEFIEGTNLEDRITGQGTCGKEFVLGILRQTAAGLSHALDVGIVHRDIKPANLLLVPAPEGFPLPSGIPMVKIADFGLAFLTEDAGQRTRLTAANSTLGSPHYMSPEQLSGDAVDHRSDIYALGATAYHMLAGVPPFQAASLAKIVTLKMSGKTPDVRDHNPAVDSDVADLVGKLMSPEARDRHDSYRELIAHLDEIHGHAASTSRLPDARTVPTVAFSSAKTVNDNDSRAEEIGEQAASRVPSIFKFAGLVGLGLIALLVLVAVFYPDRSARPRLTMVPTGWAEPLFDGFSLNRWKMSGGQWGAARDDDGANVLSGKLGSAQRQLIFTKDGKAKPLQNFRLTLFVHRHEAESVDVEVAIGARAAAGKSLAVRLEGDEAKLGALNDASLTAIAQIPLEGQQQRYHVVRIDRQQGLWWVQVEGKPLGEAIAVDYDILPDFRLTVRGGTAWFSDLLVEQLATAEAAAP